MSPSTNLLVNLVLLGLSLLSLGLIVWGIALIVGPKSRPETPQYIRFYKPGWVSTEAEIIDKHQSDDACFVSYRFTNIIKDARQSYTKTQSINSDQYNALLQGSVTEVMYPPDHPNDAELVEQQGTSIPVSNSWFPTFGSVINGVLLPFIFILNLATLGAFSQQGGAAPTSSLKLPMEMDSNAERGWSYVIGGVVFLLVIGGIALAVTSEQPATGR